MSLSHWGGGRGTLSGKAVASLKCKQTWEGAWILLEAQFSACLQMINYCNQCVKVQVMHPLGQQWDGACAGSNDNWNAHRMVWQQTLFFWALVQFMFRDAWPMCLHSHPLPSTTQRSGRYGQVARRLALKSMANLGQEIRAQCFIYSKSQNHLMKWILMNS